MDQNLEDRIRERAYEIWTAHGCVDGQADQHWLAAEREILARAKAPTARSCEDIQDAEGGQLAPGREPVGPTVRAAHAPSISSALLVEQG
jgi:hypothetical protein